MLTSADIDGFSIHGGGNGVSLVVFDLGSPQPRQVADFRPTQHGATDATTYYGPRVFELRGQVQTSDMATLWTRLDDLKGYLRLGSTHVLTFTRQGNGYAERLMARVDSPLLVPLNPGMISPFVSWGVTMFAPDPRFYSDTLSQGAYDPTDTGTGGLTFDLDFELEFGSGGSATLDVVNEGNVTTPPIFTIAGPVTNPIIDNDSTGESIHTTGLALSTGETVVIDVANRTCRLGGTTNRPDLINSSTTTWFELAPGTNQLRLRGSGMSATETELAVAFRSARI